MPRGHLSIEDRQRITITRLRNINRQKGRKDKARIIALEEENRKKDAIIQTLLLRIEELEKMVFGKRKKKANEEKDGTDESSDKKPRAPRDADSYHRPIPKKEDITREEHHPLPSSCACGAPHVRKREKTFYTEDIVLPTKEKPLKEITKHTVEQGYCENCRKWTTAFPLPPTTISLGENVRAFVAHSSVILRISHEQIIKLLRDLYSFHLSSGEINALLEKEACILEPEREKLKEWIGKQNSVHYDETSYRVQSAKETRYAWVMTGAEGTDTVFDCGKSRGKGVAKDLKGNANHIGISDDYGAYRTLFEQHQLCWAHPDRKLHDLSTSPSLDEKTKAHCQETTRQFSEMYKNLRAVLALPFNLGERTGSYPALSAAFDIVTAPHELDPKKLVAIKTSLRDRKECYFVCLWNDGTPADNNKAERSIRHLVLKRKISLGCKTERGAKTLSVLASVLLSLWWKKPAHFFDEYLALRRQNTPVLQGV